MNRKKKVRNLYQNILISLGKTSQGYEFHVWTNPNIIWDKKKRKTLKNRWHTSYRRTKHGQDVYRFNKKHKARHLKEDPHCASCHMFLVKQNCILDHIKRIQEGGSLDFENTQILCKDCDHDKWKKEVSKDIAKKKKEQYKRDKSKRIKKFNRKKTIKIWMKKLKQYLRQ